MRAVVWHGKGDLRLEDVTEPPDPGPGEAIVEVAYCGICGSDLHEYVEGPVMIRPGPHPLTGEAPPLTLGHEFSGRVAALGPPAAQDGGDALGLAVGARVAVDPCWRCNTCYWCRRGDYHLCKVGGAVGLASQGAMARYVRVPAAGLVPLPDTVDDCAGALVEPLAVGLHAVLRSGIRAGDTVLVNGFGPIGAAVVANARAAGAGAIYVSEPHAARRSLAQQLGATVAYDPAEVDVRREVFVATDRVGPDAVIDCTGIPALLPGAVDTVRKGGRVVVVGIGHGRAELEPNRLALFEREVVGSLGYRHDLPQVVELLAAGRLDPRPFVSTIVPLSEAVEAGFDLLLGDRAQLKVLIDVTAGAM
jgi:(R,R)-butanediol dehydrogenase / meso-butanediol dehydrogenase / diacetyl reductase